MRKEFIAICISGAIVLVVVIVSIAIIVNMRSKKADTKSIENMETMDVMEAVNAEETESTKNTEVLNEETKDTKETQTLNGEVKEVKEAKDEKNKEKLQKEAEVGFNLNETINGAELGVSFTEVSESVTAKEETNLRTIPNEAGDSIGIIYNGDVVTRTGIGNNGWSRISYEDQTVYAKTQLLTQDLEPVTKSPNVEVSGIVFYPFSDNVTAKIETNLRSVPSSESEDTIVAVIKNGEYVQRIGMSKRGWSRVEYNGQVLFAISSYLTN